MTATTKQLSYFEPSQVRDPRRHMLELWANRIITAAYDEHLDGKQIAISTVQPIVGPRAGALLFGMGTDAHHIRHAGRLVKALCAQDHAALRSSLPPEWDFVTGEPLAYMAGQRVKVEAPWPNRFSLKVVRLNSLMRYVRSATQESNRLGRWIAGISELGAAVCLNFNDTTPHFLIAGTSGSGKSIGLQNMVVQLTQDQRHRLILMDGKWGEALTDVSHATNLIGPLVLNLEQALSAMSWLAHEMKTRYTLKVQRRLPDDKIIIIWDEHQEWLKDDTLASLTQLLIRDGRAVGIHFVMSTHHPVVGVFGKSESKRNIPGRIALRVTDNTASQVILDYSTPSATTLTGAGDAILSTPKAIALRVQLAYVDSNDFATIPRGRPTMHEWPDYKPPELGEASSKVNFKAEEMAAGLLAKYAGKGRPTLRRWIARLTGTRQPGGAKAQRIQMQAAQVHAILAERFGLSFDSDQISLAIKELEKES